MKTVVISYKFRIYPNKEQEVDLLKNIGCSRFVYNKCLEAHMSDHELDEKLGVTRFVYDRNYYYQKMKSLKKTYEWLKDADNSSLQASYENLERAFKNFYWNGSGFPRFKSKKRSRKSFKIKNSHNTIRIENNNRIRLNKHGFFRYRDNREIQGRILSAMISFENNKWYCSVNCTDVLVEPLPKTGESIGIDLGLNNFAVFSDGMVIDKPEYQKYTIKIKKLNRELARRVKGSHHWKKTLKKVQKVYDKIKNLKNDFLHKLSKTIVETYDIICVETLSIQNMMQNHRLAEKIGYSAWYKFKRMITYKSGWYGKELIEIPRNYPSSKLCHQCGYKNENLTLKTRNWTCIQCGTNHDRDLNASINILNKGLELYNNEPSGRGG